MRLTRLGAFEELGSCLGVQGLEQAKLYALMEGALFLYRSMYSEHLAKWLKARPSSPLTPPSFIAIADRGRAIPHTFNPGSLRSRLGPTPPAADRKQSRTPFSKDVRPTPCSRLGLSQHALLCTPMHSLSLQAAHWGTRQYRTVHTPDASWRCLHDWRHLELYRIVIALGRREELISSQIGSS